MTAPTHDVAAEEAGDRLVPRGRRRGRAVRRYGRVSMTKWRWRRCPACKVVLAAGDFIWIDGSGWGDGRARRRCPTCDHVGVTADFVDVRERHVTGWIPLSPLKAAEDDPQMPLL